MLPLQIVIMLRYAVDVLQVYLLFCYTECSENVNLELRFNKINKGILRYFYVKLAFFVPTSMRFLGQLCPALVCAQELTVLATILSAPSVLMTHRRKDKSSLTVSVKNSFDLVDL